MSLHYLGVFHLISFRCIHVLWVISRYILVNVLDCSLFIFFGGGVLYYQVSNQFRTSSTLVCVFRNFPLNTEKLPASTTTTPLGKAGVQGARGARWQKGFFGYPKVENVNFFRDGFRLQVVESTSCRLIFVVDLQFMATIGNVGIVFWVCFCNNHRYQFAKSSSEIRWNLQV